MRVQERIEALREIMLKKNIDAYIIPTSGPHQSEYVADCWQFRAWISGFKGSAGTIVVTADEAGLWTDGRYFLEAEKVLRGTGIDLYKKGMPDVPDFPQWLHGKLEKGMKIGLDGKTFALSGLRELESLVPGIEVQSVDGIMDELWKDRPAEPDKPVIDFDTKYAGLSRDEKFFRLRETMTKEGAAHCLIAALADIAWLFNLRGDDIEYNPLFLGYAVVSLEKAHLFVNQLKISRDLRSELLESDVEIHDYSGIEDFLKTIEGTLILSPDDTSKWLFDLLPEKLTILEKESIPAGMKSIKNAVEISSLRGAMIKDGAALVKFLFWLKSAVSETDVTEISLAEKLKDFRAGQDGFLGESFSTIAGFREHGAIIHYKSESSTDVKIEPPGLLLVDSGGQYYEGTTDITRVIPFGIPTAAEISDFTLVLKGMIALSVVEFPAGTRGYQLDILARKALWDQHLNYDHGTGHGIGFYLNAHEGPQSISIRPIDVALEPGMITSNEPGIYRAGKYGIRIENLVLAVEKEETAFGKFIGFETLTLCPIETTMIDKSLLDENEISWLNAYHKNVYTKLAPLLEDDERLWLMEKTKPV